MRVKAPAEKNFRRARTRPGSARRSAGLLRYVSWRLVRYLVAVTFVAYAGYTATTLVLHASALQVRRIAVHGNVRISSGEVQAIVDGLRGTSILTADLVGYRRRLMESPWIADVALRRVLPSTVEIFVSERRPVGLCRLGSTLYLVDAGGTLIDEFGPLYSEFDLPIIDGLVASPSSGQPTIDPARADLAARVIDSLASRNDIARRVSQIDVRDIHDAVVMLQDDPALLHLGDEKFLERLQSYVDLAPALREQVSDIDYVDLRFGERVYVRPAAVKR
ncbi:MAG TPA: FtsQ-type POTRA domain-containing protein [Vicinamibacterales bacterium]|nr:FtsQ-type POTRA domain-containing protein [Vicinamibacterales bacterium]